MRPTWRRATFWPTTQNWTRPSMYNSGRRSKISGRMRPKRGNASIESRIKNPFDPSTTLRAGQAQGRQESDWRDGIAAPYFFGNNVVYAESRNKYVTKLIANTN